jgi:hypothetical protein
VFLNMVCPYHLSPVFFVPERPSTTRAREGEWSRIMRGRDIRKRR